MVHSYTHLSQNDPRWSQLFLGNSKQVTLGQAGCYVSSFAAVASYYGHTVTPQQINDLLKQNGLFAQNTLVSSDDDLSKLFPDIQYTTSFYFPNNPPTPANLQQLRDLMSDLHTSVIIEIDLGNGSVHFTPVVDCDGTKVTIMNVWNGHDEDFASVYGDPSIKILKFVVFHGNPVTLDPLVCDRASIRDMLVTKASAYDEFVGAGYPNVQAVSQHINALSSMNSTLQSQIDTIQKQIVSSPTPPPLTQIPAINDTPQQAKQKRFFQTRISDLFLLFQKGQSQA